MQGVDGHLNRPAVGVDRIPFPVDRCRALSVSLSLSRRPLLGISAVPAFAGHRGASLQCLSPLVSRGKFALGDGLIRDSVTHLALFLRDHWAATGGPRAIVAVDALFHAKPPQRHDETLI